MMLPLYAVSVLANALVSSINGRKQQALNEKLSRQGQVSQRENLLLQLEHSRLLHQEGYKNQIALQLRSFALSQWPLDTTPQDIAKILESGCEDDPVPLYLIIAPAESSGIQKRMYSLWTNLSHDILNAFQWGGETPVIQGRYRDGRIAHPASDIVQIFGGLANVPTLYIAPYSTDLDNVLGVTVSFWDWEA